MPVCECRDCALMKDQMEHQNLSEWLHKAPYDIRTLLVAHVAGVPVTNWGVHCCAFKFMAAIGRVEPDFGWFPWIILLAEQARQRVLEVGNVYFKTIDSMVTIYQFQRRCRRCQICFPWTVSRNVSSAIPTQEKKMQQWNGSQCRHNFQQQRSWRSSGWNAADPKLECHSKASKEDHSFS